MCPPGSNTPAVPRDENTTVELIGDGLVMRQPTEYTYITGEGNKAMIGMRYTISTPTADLIEDNRCTGEKGGDFCALNTFNVTVYAKGN